MRIGLISDTHIPDVAQSIPYQVAEVFSGVDLILHAGDIFVASVLDELQEIAPVVAARGDDDYGIFDDRIKEVQQLTIDGLHLYAVHSSRYWARSLILKPQDHDLTKAPDIVIHGHTHRETVERINESLLVSPGSATFPEYQLRLGTVALLTINNGQADARIIKLWEV